MEKSEFKNVYGYQEVKNELNLIKSWYEDPTILGNPKITLPKGILFYGDPGNGKTLFVREFLDNLMFRNISSKVVMKIRQWRLKGSLKKPSKKSSQLL